MRLAFERHSGTSDARGCGQSFHYDAGGRIVAEDYSPCLEAHADYRYPLHEMAFFRSLPRSCIVAA